jgi:hypothetical protein
MDIKILCEHILCQLHINTLSKTITAEPKLALSLNAEVFCTVHLSMVLNKKGLSQYKLCLTKAPVTKLER